MKVENEITVRVTCSLDELTNIMISNGFKVEKKYKLTDKYYFKKGIDIYNEDVYNVLSNYLLIRSTDNGEIEITYKYKEFLKDGSIKRQGKTNLDVLKEEQAQNMLDALGYECLFEINNENIWYTKDGQIIYASFVNGEYVCVEYEGKNNETIEELICEFEKFNIPYDNSNYYLNKAIIEINNLKNSITN